jgi:transcriptional regulator with XRE-family HTH domain
MHVQWEILEEILKEKDMSQAKLAKKSGVSENTISNWKKGLEARKSYVERVAKALGTSVGRLTGSDRSERKVNGNYEQVLLELVSHHYGVSADTIIKLAPILFSVIARRALAKRLSELEDWYDKLEDAARPPIGIKLSDADRSVSDELSFTIFNETYWDERNRRENGDLSVEQFQGLKDGKLQTIDTGTEAIGGRHGTDLFFQELFEIDTTGAISDHDEYAANLKDCDKDIEYFFSQDGCEIPDSVCPGSSSAAEYLRSGDVRIPQIPTGLFKRGKEQELADWINAKGEPATKKRLAIIDASNASQNSDGGSDA